MGRGRRWLRSGRPSNGKTDENVSVSDLLNMNRRMSVRITWVFSTTRRRNARVPNGTLRGHHVPRKQEWVNQGEDHARFLQRQRCGPQRIRVPKTVALDRLRRRRKEISAPGVCQARFGNVATSLLQPWLGSVNLLSEVCVDVFRDVWGARKCVWLLSGSTLKNSKRL